MPSARFEPAIHAIEQLQPYALDRKANRTVNKSSLLESIRNNKEFPIAFLNRWLASLIHCKERILLFATTLAITPFQDYACN